MLVAHKVLALLVVGSALVIGCGKGQEKPVPASQSQVKHTVYHCPMHPQIVKDGPGDCPICAMALVPIETNVLDTGKGGQEGAYPVVRLEGSTTHSLGIRITSPSQAKIGDSLGVAVWSIPAQSLVRTEGRQVVVLYLGNGLYQPRDVKIGTETRTSVEVLDGLEAEDKVVVSGQFLLMSQSELQAKGSNHE
jgi:hypothetical protein